MQFKTNYIKESLYKWSNTFSFKIILLGTLIMTAFIMPVKAQDVQYTTPSLWLGVAAGANLNFYNGSTQNLNADITAPVVFNKGFGVGLYAAPLIEFYRPNSMFGGMLQIGYDGRSATFDTETSPCNCPRDLSAKLSYLTIEPSLRFAPFRSDFYLFAGPRLAFNLNNSFTYKQGPNPDIPDQEPEPDVNGDMNNMNKSIISMQVGAGYDFHLSAKGKKNQFMLSPFVSFHPYLGQNPRSIETWNITTLRVGMALKFGRGKVISTPEKMVMAEPKINLKVSTPANLPIIISATETFPVRNYVFFESQSTDISNRYVSIKPSQVKDFHEDQLEDFSPKHVSGRSSRQMTVYYNVINILGDRMYKNPNTTVTLVGSSENGPEDGKLMAKSVQKYLVRVFGIDTSRIIIEGRGRPVLPSEKVGATESLELLRQDDRRVSISSNSPILLMEFQNGITAPLKPIEIVSFDATVDSIFSCSIDGINCTSWSLEVKDDKGKIQKYGPYYDKTVGIPNNLILGTRQEGDYKITMIGTTITGQILKTDTTIHLKKWVAPIIQEVMRFSILYEFNESKAIQLYEKYLTEIVVPKIPMNGKVIISGYTDIIGEADYNQKLSKARANDVKVIMQAALTKAGRSDVEFTVNGFGEDVKLSPFENKYPEERFYNRTVIIDIMPAR